MQSPGKNAITSGPDSLLLLIDWIKKKNGLQLYRVGGRDQKRGDRFLKKPSPGFLYFVSLWYLLNRVQEFVLVPALLPTLNLMKS